MRSVDLFGRRELLDRLAASSAAVTLLVGDSGTGKTAVLEELQSEATAVAPDPVQVTRAPGSLQVALLDGLAAAVSLMVNDMTAAERAGRLLVDAAGRVADKRLENLRAAIGRHLLSLVRARVGDEMADFFADVRVGHDSHSRGVACPRITAASDGEVVDQIVSFAGEVVGLAAGRDIQVALDDLDRLDDGDLRRLADLPDRLPAGFKIRGAFTTWHSTSRQRFETLQLGGVQGLSISGLTERDIEAWLDAEGIDNRLAPRVMAATNGYPVHVADAVALLQRDPSPETLATLTPDQIVEVRHEAGMARTRLSKSGRRRKALCLQRPASDTPGLPTARGRRAGMGDSRPSIARDAGLLLDDERRWFHELRRRVIWRDLISEEMRRVSIDAATDELRTQLALPTARPADFADFAVIAAQNRGLQNIEAGLGAAVEATTDELAIAAAALKLIEYSQGERAIDAEVLLAYTRTAYSIDRDPLGALDRLVDRGPYARRLKRALGGSGTDLGK